ncbi:MAG TPA: hypothetical protein VHZ51_22905 [Ktedonobacteraceae bacterium]|nr:hypothetical protein [Ktedonobacteraceae bacterium]
MVQVTPSLLDAFLDCCGGRRGDYAVQRDDGRYMHVWQPLTYETVFAHLRGDITIGVYLIDEAGYCHSAVLDSDMPDGLVQLSRVQTHLAVGGWASYLEATRRGAHLRVFFAEPVAPAVVRRWLRSYCPAGVELYPKRATCLAETAENGGWLVPNERTI